MLAIVFDLKDLEISKYDIRKQSKSNRNSKELKRYKKNHINYCNEKEHQQKTIERIKETQEKSD